MVWSFGCVLPANLAAQQGEWPVDGEEDIRETHIITNLKLKEFHSTDEWKWGSLTISAVAPGWVCPTVVHFRNLAYDNNKGWPVEYSVVRRSGYRARGPEVYLWHYKQDGAVMALHMRIRSCRDRQPRHLYNTRGAVVWLELNSGSKLCVRMDLEPDKNGKTTTYLTGEN